MAKPTKYPDWTVNSDGTDHDVTDPTSGQNNVAEPDSTRKQTGWLFDELPPRQYFNWLSRLTTQWIRWIDDYITVTLDGIINVINGAISSAQDDISNIQGTLANDIFITGNPSVDPATEQGIDLTLPGGVDISKLVVLSARIHKGTSTFDDMFAGTYIDSNNYFYVRVTEYPPKLRLVVKLSDGGGARNMNYTVLIRIYP